MDYGKQLTREEFGRAVLKQHLEMGIVWFDVNDRCYVGKAADGVTVQLGDDKESAAKYLERRPNPSQW